jgi:hypothetical protein
VRASTLPETDLPFTVMATEMVITLLPHIVGSRRANERLPGVGGLSQAVHRPVKRITDYG